MKIKLFSAMAIGVLLGVSGMALFGQSERDMHPRISNAITALQEARQYMQNAPHDFGGHKAAAMQACTDAIQKLRLALQYRGQQDHKR